MKTAMQDLIKGIDGSVKIINEIGGNEITIRTLISVKNVAIDLLEKEKKQIIDAHLEGWGDAYDYLKDRVIEPRQAEDYYNETYNQNDQI